MTEESDWIGEASLSFNISKVLFNHDVEVGTHEVGLLFVFTRRY